MKKKLTLIVALIITAQVFAAPVSKEEAKEIARQFMIANKGNDAQQSLDLSLSEKDMETALETDEYYIFNNDNSYVVVSGDDRTIPVLGWSDEGKYDAEKANPSVLQWLDYYKQEIQSLDGDVTPVKKLTSKSEITPIVPFKWDQVAPFNNMVPIDPKTGKRSLTGCPSVSLAQVIATMKYGKMNYNIPEQNVYMYEGEKRVLKQHLDGLEKTTFNWDILKPTYSANETGASVDEVAKLMKYCGYGLGTIYTSSLSSATSLSNINATTLYFGYPDTKIAYRSAYTKENWEDLIYNELKEGYPVIHDASKSANGKTSGHSFIIDGYKNGYYHVNWGWGGEEDGYFMLSVLNSDYPEEKGANVTEGYNIYRSVIYNFRRPAAGTKISDSYALSINRIGINGQYEYQDIYKVTPKNGKFTFYHTLELNHSMAPYVDRNYQLGWNIYSYKYNQFEMNNMVTDDGMKVNLLSGEVKKLDELYTDISENTENGDYALVWFYRDLHATDNGWYQVPNANDDYIYIKIYNGELTVFPNYDEMIRQSDIVVNNVRVEQNGTTVPVVSDIPQVKVYEKASIIYNIKNETCSNNRGVYLWMSNDDNKYEMTCGRGMDINTQATGEVEMRFTPYSVGDFWVVLNNESETYNKNENIKATKLYVTGTSMSADVSNGKKTADGRYQLTYNGIEGEVMMTTTENLPYKSTLYLMVRYQDENGNFIYDEDPDSRYNLKVENEFTTSKEIKENFTFSNLDTNKQYRIGIGKEVDGKIQVLDSYSEIYVTPVETAVVGINESTIVKDAPVKVIKNGKLYIGNYNIAGQRVK